MFFHLFRTKCLEFITNFITFFATWFFLPVITHPSQKCKAAKSSMWENWNLKNLSVDEQISKKSMFSVSEISFEFWRRQSRPVCTIDSRKLGQVWFWHTNPSPIIHVLRWSQGRRNSKYIYIRTVSSLRFSFVVVHFFLPGLS